jgi:hypothetical protein
VDARLLTRITNTMLVAVAGMTAGHLLRPSLADATAARRSGFVAIVAASGALAAWRERSARDEERQSPSPGGAVWWMVAGAIAALALAWIAYFMVHG